MIAFGMQPAMSWLWLPFDDSRRQEIEMPISEISGFGTLGESGHGSLSLARAVAMASRRSSPLFHYRTAEAKKFAVFLQPNTDTWRNRLSRT